MGRVFLSAEEAGLEIMIDNEIGKAICRRLSYDGCGSCCSASRST